MNADIYTGGLFLNRKRLIEVLPTHIEQTSDNALVVTIRAYAGKRLRLPISTRVKLYLVGLKLFSSVIY